MKNKLLVIGILIGCITTAKVLANSFIVYKGYNYITLELRNETSHPIDELNIQLNDNKTATDISMEPLTISLPTSKSIHEITLPIIVQNIESRDEKIAEFVIADGSQRIWNFSITLKVKEKMLDKNDLMPNFPNPFNSATTIHYSNAQAGKVLLNVYNINGELIRTLVNNRQPEGIHSVKWDGTNGNGQEVKPGIYFYQIQTNGFSESHNMLLLK